MSVVRHGPASSSAARRKTAARSSHGVRDQSCQASAAALIARSTSAVAALVDVGEHVAPCGAASPPRTCRRCAPPRRRSRTGSRGAPPPSRRAGAQLRPLGRARRVALDRLVDRRGRPEDPVATRLEPAPGAGRRRRLRPWMRRRRASHAHCTRSRRRQSRRLRSLTGKLRRACAHCTRSRHRQSRRLRSLMSPSSLRSLHPLPAPAEPAPPLPDELRRAYAHWAIVW